jgi:hypothetical protein
LILFLIGLDYGNRLQRERGLRGRYHAAQQELMNDECFPACTWKENIARQQLTEKMKMAKTLMSIRFHTEDAHTTVDGDRRRLRSSYLTQHEHKS